MSSTERQPSLEIPGSFLLISRLGLVSLLSGLLIVLAYQLTLPEITANKRRAVQTSVLGLLPGAARSQAFVLNEAGALSPANDQAGGEKIYAVYGGNGQLLGVAIEAAGQGYQDVLRILYAFDPDRQCISGFAVLKSSETPGLGSKIATDAGFKTNFDCLDASVNPALTALKHPLTTVKHGSKQHPWEIDAIAGATVTSNAVGKMLNSSAQYWHPLLIMNLQLLRDAAGVAAIR